MAVADLHKKLADQWHRSVVKYWGQHQSGQAIKTVSGTSKNLLFLTSFILDDAKIAALSNNSFE